MKLTIAMAVSMILCGASLARASIVHRRAGSAAQAAQLTPVKQSESSAMSGLDFRLGSRLKKFASQRSPDRAHGKARG